MEMSFIPSGKARRDDAEEQDEYSGGTKRAERNKKIERFGAGMEKGQMDEETSGRGGRTQRRHVGRSASKNAFRRR
jgi:ribosome biogenesis protein ENP2